MTDMWFYEKIKLDGERNVYDYMKLIVDLTPGYRDLVKYTFAVLDAVDYKYGPCHTELMIDEEGPVLIEVNPRLSGGDMPKELGEECFGYTAIECILDAYLDVERFEKRGQDFYQPLKHAMYKMLISPKNAKVDEIPAAQLFEVLPSVRQKNFGGVFKTREIAKTIDVLSSPANAWLVHEDEKVLMRDYSIIHYMESNCFELLFEEETSISAKEKEEMERALFNLQDTMHFMPNAVFVVDKDFVNEISERYTCLSLDQVTSENLPEKIENVIYHCGTRFETLDELFKKLSVLEERLVEGGWFVITPWGASSVPYGERGMECVLMAMGMQVKIAKSNSRKLMQKIIIAGKR